MEDGVAAIAAADGEAVDGFDFVLLIAQCRVK